MVNSLLLLEKLQNCIHIHQSLPVSDLTTEWLASSVVHLHTRYLTKELLTDLVPNLVIILRCPAFGLPWSIGSLPPSMTGCVGIRYAMSLGSPLSLSTSLLIGIEGPPKPPKTPGFADSLT